MKTQPARAALELAEIEATARQALGEVRKTITGYRSEGFSSDDRTHAVDPRLPDLAAVVRSAIRFDVPIYAFDPEGEVRVRPAALVRHARQHGGAGHAAVRTGRRAAPA